MGIEGKYVANGGFHVKAGELKTAVERFKHVVPEKATDEIFERLLLYQIKYRLELHGSDGEMYASFTLNVEPIEGFGSIIDIGLAVHYKMLTDFLKEVPDEAILKCLYARNEKGIPHMLIESEYGRGVFHGIDHHNYPKDPCPRPDNIVLMDEDAFRDMVARTLFAADDAEYSSLSSVYFDFLPDRTNFVATNRAILSMYTRTDLEFPMVKGKPKSIIVPAKALEAFMTGIKGLPHIGGVLIYPLEEYVILAHRGFTLSSKLISAEYPDYQRVIPKETPHVAPFERDKLRKAVKRLIPVTDRAVQRIQFAFSGGGSELFAHDEYREMSGKETVPCKYEGQALKIDFSAKLLLSILDNIKGDRIVMRIASSNRPVIIEPEPQSLLFNMLCLIMPLAEKK